MARPIEWTEEKIESEADFMIEWAKKPDSIVMGTCYGSRGYTYQDAKDWSVKNTKFREAKLLAFTLVGARRETGGLINKLNSGLISRTMPLYDPEYNAHVMALKKSQDDENSIELNELRIALDALKDQPIVSNVDQAPLGH